LPNFFLENLQIFVFIFRFPFPKYANYQIFYFFSNVCEKFQKNDYAWLKFLAPSKRHKKIHALSAWFFRFYRSLWLCS